MCKTNKKNYLENCKQEKIKFEKCMEKEENNVISCQIYKFVYENCLNEESKKINVKKNVK